MPNNAHYHSSMGSLLAGGGLGATLLAWLMLTLFAPGLGSVIAVFGSPAFSFFVILRLLTLDTRARTPPLEIAAPNPLADLHLHKAVAAQSGGKCFDCGAHGSLCLHPVLPVGRAKRGLERRFVALCPTCLRARCSPGRP